MRLPDTTQTAVNRLDQAAESAHFVVRFASRNPALGVASGGAGAYGIWNPCAISRYVTALEALYEMLASAPFSWPRRPNSDGGEKIAVYVLYLPSVGMSEPFTAVDRNWVPYICLRSRFEEPVLESALHRAEMEAVHEATHLFCWSARPPRGLAERQWFWFGEATAVFMEAQVFPNNLDTIRFGMDWCDFPEWPLDNDRAWYQAGFFVQYLAHRFGAELISRIWNDSLPNEGPLNALNRMLPESRRATLESMCWLFGEYAHDSYFLWDEKSFGFHQDLFSRFGMRALTESFVLGVGEQVRSESVVDHLACRYFRIEISRGVGRVEVVQRSEVGSGRSLRCFLTAHVATQRRGTWRELTPLAAGARHGEAHKHRGTEMSAALQGEEMKNTDWLLLTVANCGMRSRQTEATEMPHDDQVGFSFEIRASE